MPTGCWQSPTRPDSRAPGVRAAPELARGDPGQDGPPRVYVPQPRPLSWQWYWDSCFHAIAWRRLIRPRAARARVAAGRPAPDGFIGHTIFWQEPLRGSRRYIYNVISSDDPMTSSIQPPLLAWAWRIAVGDPAAGRGSAPPRLAGGAPRPGRGRPDLDRRPRRVGAGRLQPIRRHLGPRGPRAARLPRLSPQPPAGLRSAADRRRRRAGVLRGRHQRPLQPVRLALGHPSLTPALIERTYDERRGLFAPRSRPAPARTPATTIAALAPLALPDLPEDIGRRLVEEHLLDPGRFWTAGGAAVGVAAGAELQRQRPRAVPPAPLLAGTDLGQHRLAVLAGAGAPRL